MFSGVVIITFLHHRPLPLSAWCRYFIQVYILFDSLPFCIRKSVLVLSASAFVSPWCWDGAVVFDVVASSSVNALILVTGGGCCCCCCCWSDCFCGCCCCAMPFNELNFVGRWMTVVPIGGRTKFSNCK